jgi:hypothetical protein
LLAYTVAACQPLNTGNNFSLFVYDISVATLLTFKSLAVYLRTAMFNIKKFHVVLALRLRNFYGSQNRQRLLLYTLLIDWLL